MAEIGRIRNVYRPLEPEPIAGGESGWPVFADALRVELGRVGNDVVVDLIDLPFADYAGLEAEWEAGTATTVLLAALNAELAGKSLADGGLTTAQRAILGVEVTI